MAKELTLPGPEVPVIDADRLLAEFGGNQEILNELRDLFLEHAPPLYTSIMAAATAGDLTVLARDAHSFKGACSTYGAPRLAHICKEFELAAKAGDGAAVQPYLEAFRREYDAVCEALGKVNTV